MPDDRRQYRHLPDFRDYISVEVVRSEQRESPQRVCNLSVGGIGLFFQHHFDPIYQLGSTVYLHITSPNLDKKVVAPCLVTHRMESEDGRTYGFEFVDWIGLLSQISAELAAMFNQRGEFRVEPPADQVIGVCVEVPGEECAIRAEIQDLSPEGVCLRIQIKDEQLLSNCEEAKLFFSLPDSQELLTFRATILRRDLVGDHICYGTYLEEEGTEYFKEKQLKLIKYVTEVRQQTQASIQT